MIECRAVKSEELDAMLSLMCDAFGLPFGPARELFYKDPYFDIDRKRVLVIDGEIGSCLTIVEAPLWIGRAVVNVAGIAGVATAPAHRRKGYAARLLVETLPAIREMGCPFAALFPFSYDYYRKLGWERVGTQYTARVPCSTMPKFAEARHVRTAHSADRPDIARIYKARTLLKTGRWVRDERRWSYLFDHVKSHVVYKHNSLDGYALYETRDDPGGRSIRILEMYTVSEEARRGLLGYVAQLADVQTLSWTTSLADLLASGFLAQSDIGPDGSPAISPEPGPMFRIVDLSAALTALTPNFEGWKGEMLATMTDSQVPAEWPRGARMTGDETGIHVEPIGKGDPLLRSRNRIDGDVRAWTQTLTGFLSLQDAVSLNRLRAFDPGWAAAAGQTASKPIFPRRELFIPAADHF